MNLQQLSNSPTSLYYFQLFAQGDENGLTYLYRQLYKPLLYYGLQIIADDFSVNTVVQDAFLKSWRFRDRLTGLAHAYRFMRMNVTWHCCDYYRKPEHKYAAAPSILETLPTDFEMADIEEKIDGTGNSSNYEELLQSIYNVIPYLPPTRQMILTLYFKYGFSYKQIAKRFSANHQSISKELQKALEHLKTVIHAQKRFSTGNLKNPIDSGISLENDLLTIFTLRREKKMGFEEIAKIVNIPVPVVQQQYILAHSKLVKS